MPLAKFSTLPGVNLGSRQNAPSPRRSAVVASAQSHRNQEVPSTSGTIQWKNIAIGCTAAILAPLSLDFAALPARADIPPSLPGNTIPGKDGVYHDLTPCSTNKALQKRETKLLKGLEKEGKKTAKSYGFPEDTTFPELERQKEQIRRRYEGIRRGNNGHWLCHVRTGNPHYITTINNPDHWYEFLFPGLTFIYIVMVIGYGGRLNLMRIKGQLPKEMGIPQLPAGEATAYNEIVPTEIGPNGEIRTGMADTLTCFRKALAWPLAIHEEIQKGTFIQGGSLLENETVRTSTKNPFNFGSETFNSGNPPSQTWEDYQNSRVWKENEIENRVQAE